MDLWNYITHMKSYTLPFQIRCIKWFSKAEKGQLIGSGWFTWGYGNHRVQVEQKTTQHLSFLKAESHTRCNTYHRAAFLPRQTCVLKLREAPDGPQQRAHCTQGSFLRTGEEPTRRAQDLRTGGRQAVALSKLGGANSEHSEQKGKDGLSAHWMSWRQPWPEKWEELRVASSSCQWLQTRRWEQVDTGNKEAEGRGPGGEAERRPEKLGNQHRRRDTPPITGQLHRNRSQGSAF